jgi:hypothetical protein
MVAINKSDNNFIFEVKGLHKLWALKHKITIPMENIQSVKHTPEMGKGWKNIRFGLRMPGTYIPFVIKAGTYYTCDKIAFWDVIHSKNCITVALKDSNYNELVIEVANPEEAIKMLGH